MGTTLVWYANNFRIDDHPALAAAAERGAVVPVYVYEPDYNGPSAMGGASMWWAHQSIKALAEDLESLGSGLVIRSGDPAAHLAHPARRESARRRAGRPRPSPASSVCQARTGSPDRPKERDCAGDPEGNPRAVGVFEQCWSGLSDIEPHGCNAVRRRSAADPAGHTDRQSADGSPLHFGRTEHRLAPTRQRTAYRYAERDA